MNKSTSDWSPDFLQGGGEMGELTRQLDWSQTSIGAPGLWPLSLRLAVRLILTSRHPMFIWWGPDLVQFYNDAYRSTMGPERHPSALGQPGRDCWEEIWPIIGPQIEMVMAGRGSTWNEDQLVPVTRHGVREDVWWTYGYSPIQDDDAPNGVGGVLVVCNDVTERHIMVDALRTSEDRLRGLFEQAPGFIAVLKGPEHQFELCNAAYLRLVGGRQVVGQTVREALPDVEGQGFYELLDQVYSTGRAFVGRSAEIHLQGEQRFLDFVYQPIRDHAGAVNGIFVQGSDVTEQKRSEEHRQLLVNELNHRVKNTLSTIQAVAQQTLRDEIPMPAARGAFVDRLMAMSRNHNLLTDQNWEGAELVDVIDKALEAHVPRERLRRHGPPVWLGPREALAMGLAFHELSTNAAKYGALSTDAGRIEVTWTTTLTAGGLRLALEWREAGGPPVTPPRRKGFGARLIERGLAHDLEGEALLLYEPTGLVCRITAPISAR